MERRFHRHLWHYGQKLRGFCSFALMQVHEVVPFRRIKVSPQMLPVPCLDFVSDPWMGYDPCKVVIFKLAKTKSCQSVHSLASSLFTILNATHSTSWCFKCLRMRSCLICQVYTHIKTCDSVHSQATYSGIDCLPPNQTRQPQATSFRRCEVCKAVQISNHTWRNHAIHQPASNAKTWPTGAYTTAPRGCICDACKKTNTERAVHKTSQAHLRRRTPSLSVSNSSSYVSPIIRLACKLGKNT